MFSREKSVNINLCGILLRTRHVRFVIGKVVTEKELWWLIACFRASMRMVKYLFLKPGFMNKIFVSRIWKSAHSKKYAEVMAALGYSHLSQLVF